MARCPARVQCQQGAGMMATASSVTMTHQFLFDNPTAKKSKKVVQILLTHQFRIQFAKMQLQTLSRLPFLTTSLLINQSHFLLSLSHNLAALPHKTKLHVHVA